MPRIKKPSFGQVMGRYFVRGLLVFAPLAGTVVMVVWTLSFIDRIVPAAYPGVGIAILLGSILLTGFIVSSVVGEAMVRWVERAIKPLPLVNLLYSSIKDLLGAFVGDKKSFDKPVAIRFDREGHVRTFGFVTCERFDDPRLKGLVAVYLPQAYNFAGNMILVRREQIDEVDADPAQFMAFIVSGGVSEMGGARTVMATASMTQEIAEQIKAQRPR